MTTLTQSITRNSVSLGLFSIFTVGLIALTYVMTQERIVEQVRAFEIKALNEIVPPDAYDNDLLQTLVTVDDAPLLGLDGSHKAYFAFHQQQPVAAILPVWAPDGYNGRISLLVGIHYNGELAAVRVITHRETPGLGDAIDTKVSDWIHQFQGLSLLNTAPRQWGVQKDGGQFDQFTGATITPRAIVGAVHRSLKYFDEHRDALFAEARLQFEQATPQEVQ
ncbi:electron transport complex subunit RsxG [Aestuariirhabdus litorea]|uniref:Ion-translocating oxidoreductase complex subunit G n=1 Tax=Aestuariirhabdus litorea TaxID=2528527 RepID=A0A3P3VR80_9GAMM|nr:electron transport complex subunit RsxG [Aestuariirhabdus litorea]RRJ85130.1 electron transport complex subunit RsxG [Aestuariirhabdus litorea]RWW98354.1 electron transport complex subunit RsxG [Endozoicomonadaceae bacterium GTF-13]